MTVYKSTVIYFFICNRGENYMQKSFLSEIKEIPHTYTKINFDTSKIKNIDNIYEAYEIPRSEKIVAFIKSSIILAPLSLGGNIITDRFRSYVVMLYCKKMIWQKW